MPPPNSPFVPPTAEFVALCQAQIALLVQSLQADWCAVYLTADAAAGEEANLIPIAAYPQPKAAREKGTALPTWPEVGELTTPTLPLLSSTSPSIPQLPSDIGLETATDGWASSAKEGKQPMVFPLIYEGEETVMGLLVAGRRNRLWNRQELGQLEKIARTLAIARLLDWRQGWYQEQVSQQQARWQLERNRLDDLLHQLRNPLTALRTFSKLLLKRLLPDEQGESTARGILRESERLQELLQEFEADIAAIAPDTNDEEAEILTCQAAPSVSAPPFLLPSQAPNLAGVAVRDVLEPLLASAQAIAQERGIELIIDLKPDLPLVMANARALREVFSNLIDNALKYTPAGGSVQVITGLSRASQGEFWQGTAIRDKGYGIPPADRERLFERHYRGVQAEGDIPGTGLGLAIARELLEQMGGTIEVLSPNELATKGTLPGTTFQVWLPQIDRIANS